MKSKKTTYILIVLVLGIWGYVAYSLLKPEDEFSFTVQNEVFDQDVKDTTLVNTQLDLSYSDPFLNRKIIKSKHKVESYRTNQKSIFRTPKPVHKKNKEEFINWPNIQYAGTVNESLGLVKFNGKKIFVKKNDTFHEVLFVSFNSDSLRIEYKNKRRAYPKNEIR